MVLSDVSDDPYFSTVIKIPVYFYTGIVRFLRHRAKPLGFVYSVQIEPGGKLYTFDLHSYIFLPLREP
jgi:hypothetical protein